MRKTVFIVTCALASLAPSSGYAITTNNDTVNNEKSLFEEVTKIEKKTNKFNLYLNTQANFNLDWQGEGGTEFQGGKFRFKHLRIEMQGQINDWLSYKYRQRLNKGETPSQNWDNLWQAIDVAEVGFRVNKVNIVAGKQWASYGGIEYDLNPIEVYQFCDMVEYMSNFMTGVRAEWQFKPNHQFQFQIIDDVSESPEAMYGGNITRAKLPLMYTANWNGSFGNGLYQTRWSASFMNEIKDHHMWFLAFGNRFNFTPRWGAWFDVMYSREGIDRQGLITSIVGPQDNITVNRDGEQVVIGHNAYNTEYLTLLFHMNYFIAPKWNIFGKVCYETNGVYKASGDVAKGNYGIDWLYVGGVEFYPLKDRGLHFFVTYIGQTQKHSSMAQNLYGANAVSHNNMLTCGFIWKMPLF